MTAFSTVFNNALAQAVPVMVPAVATVTLAVAGFALDELRKWLAEKSDASRGARIAKVLSDIAYELAREAGEIPKGSDFHDHLDALATKGVDLATARIGGVIAAQGVSPARLEDVLRSQLDALTVTRGTP